jgi:phosphate transport system permease protein
MPLTNFEKGGSLTLQRVHAFTSHPSAVTQLSASRRDKGFVSADQEGNVSVHHSTSAQTLLKFPGTGSSIRAMMFSPKANGVIVLDQSAHLQTLKIDNPHPEISFSTLFLPIIYEGYEQAETIWQSSSGSDDFEPKFGMWPLIFGTLKGTIYAMMLAVPLAVMGAVYTGMFMSPNMRGIVKPIIEIMAALPSVVLGFLAGLWLAPLLEEIIPAVVAMVVVTPIMVAVICLLWHFAPGLPRSSKMGYELWLLMGIVIVSTLGCLAFNEQIEGWVFQSDYKQWLMSVFDLQYDQRNALVISFAMGFAVIPIIFSISEDSISNVPRHLIAGSLAMGATQWQTLTRLVLISASPGIFSALMIGFGRAVGETMIVLMATGNTPILDWSLFNGFRTLSANIAVEMPEAPHGGTLYRVLFLSGLLLFAFTFAINTVAEVVRQRLREKYSQY